MPLLLSLVPPHLWPFQLQTSQKLLDLMPWSSPAVERERRLHEAGRLAYDLGARDLVPLKLRLVLEENPEPVTPGSGNDSDVIHDVIRSSSGIRRDGETGGAMEIVREVLRCNPGAYGGSRVNGDAYGYDGDGIGTDNNSIDYDSKEEKVKEAEKRRGGGCLCFVWQYVPFWVENSTETCVSHDFILRLQWSRSYMKAYV